MTIGQNARGDIRGERFRRPDPFADHYRIGDISITPMWRRGTSRVIPFASAVALAAL